MLPRLGWWLRLNDMTAEHDGPGRTRAAGVANEIACAALVLGILYMVALAMRELPPPVTPGTGTIGGMPAAPPMQPCVMDTPGYLRGAIYGRRTQRIAWQGDEFACEGTPRPDGEGVRLFFAGGSGREGRVVMVIGVDERPERLAGREHPANVTIIEELARAATGEAANEAGSLFYSSVGRNRCWTTVRRVMALAPALWRVDGVFYCAGALPSVNGDGSITLEEFSYSGRVNMSGT